jgi:hypothetical protein
MSNLENWKPGDPIGYIRREIPEFEVPAYEGQRYEVLVPDTLDLQERAALGVNGITGPADPLADFEQYFHAYFRSNPPRMDHSFDSQCQSKLMESLPLMRIISGSDLNAEVDRRWMEVILHQLGPDGLAYMPAKGRPWALLGIEDALPERAKTLEQHIMPYYCGRLLSAMMLYHLRDGGSLWWEAAERLVDGLSDLAVDRGRYAYFAPHVYWAERGNTDDPAKDFTHVGLELRGMVLGLVHVYRETGYEPANRLAKKLIHYMLDVCKGFDEAGRFTAVLPPPRTTHFHVHAYALQSILEYARVTGDESLLELTRKGYEYGKSKGNMLLGYFPEMVNSAHPETSELCEVADMIALGLKLTDAGIGDYWDDVDRWTRNMFAEGQLLHTDWIDRLQSDIPPTRIDEPYHSTENVAERNLGAFAGWPKANDWGTSIMHCCTGNATRAMYYVWDHILTYESGKLRVNLLLNRASPWADVDSHIPYVGQVDVRVKEAVDLWMRIPEWVSAGEVRVQVNGAVREVSWEGRYAGVCDVKPGDVAAMHFPIAERTETVWIQKEKYRLVRKGNEVVVMDPPGRYCPLYQRAHYRENGTRWRKVERFASEEQIHW